MSDITQIYHICKNIKCPKFNPDILNCPDLKTCRYKNIFLVGNTDNQFLDNKLHGKWIYRYENGQKWGEREYKNGESHGKHITWYENGKKSSEREYKNGKQCSKCIRWNENGKMMDEAEYKDGVFIKEKYF